MHFHPTAAAPRSLWLASTALALTSLASAVTHAAPPSKGRTAGAAAAAAAVTAVNSTAVTAVHTAAAPPSGPAVHAPSSAEFVRRSALTSSIPAAALPYTSIIQLDHPRLEEFAIHGGGQLADFPLGATRLATLELHPVMPFSSDAQIEVVEQSSTGQALTKPLTSNGIFLSGHVAGIESSHAFLASSAAGVFGYVEVDGTTYIISSGPFGSKLGIASYDLTHMPEGVINTPPWACATADPDEPTAVGDGGGLAGVQPCRQVRIAYETDYEFLQLFSGNTAAATGYVGTMAAALTSIYSRDVNARLSLRYLRLWSTSNDPWNATSTSAELEEFGAHWQLNMNSVVRELAHFLSGRGLGGGVAYLPGLCNSGAAYGVSANLGGYFPTPLVDNYDGNWDIYVVAHELGHNFGAPHTHNYAPPLDGCGSSPQDCTAADLDIGTIMSYCHICSGGVANIKLQFHPGNIASIEQRFAQMGCALTGPSVYPVTMNDRGNTVSAAPVLLDVLANEIEFNCEDLIIASFLETSVSGGTVTRSVGSGIGGRDQLLYTPPSGSYAGEDVFTYRVRDTSNQEMVATVFVDVVSVRIPENPVGATPQLDVSYYALVAPAVLPNFSSLTPYLSSTTADVNVVSTNGNFATSGRADDVGALYRGWVNIPTAGAWTFFTSSDDGSRLLIGNTVVVSNDGLHGMVEQSGTILLGAGRHAIRIEFFERTGGAGMVASWQGPAVAKAVMPASALFHGGADLASDLDNSGTVSGPDLSIMLSSWGNSGGPADVNRDGNVNAADLAVLLSAWTG